MNFFFLPWLQRAQSDYDETCTKYELRLKEKNDEIQVREREGERACLLRSLWLVAMTVQVL